MNRSYLSATAVNSTRATQPVRAGLVKPDGASRKAYVSAGGPQTRRFRRPRRARSRAMAVLLYLHPVVGEDRRMESVGVPSSGGRLLLAGSVGALVALSLGIYGNVHDPAADLSITLGFKDTITMKVWLASLAVLFAVVQVGSALWMFGKLPLAAGPAWLGSLHRISGRTAFLLSLPVAYHCLYQLAFQDTSTRVLIHSLLGCAFYGAFAAKVVVVRSRSLPGIALPLAGGALFTLLVGVWLTSGWWFISTNGLPSP